MGELAGGVVGLFVAGANFRRKAAVVRKADYVPYAKLHVLSVPDAWLMNPEAPPGVGRKCKEPVPPFPGRQPASVLAHCWCVPLPARSRKSNFSFPSSMLS